MIPRDENSEGGYVTGRFYYWARIENQNPFYVNTDINSNALYARANPPDTTSTPPS